MSAPRRRAESLARQVRPVVAAMLRAAVTGRGEEYPRRVPWVVKMLDRESKQAKRSTV